MANIKNTPAGIIFAIATLEFLEFIPLSKRYTARILKNKPSGSDLNQPIWPRIMMGIETEKSVEANNPAVVPPIVLTSAKTTMVVNEPIITGNNNKRYSG